MDQRPPPEVTIHDPAHPQRPADLLAAGDDAPSPARGRTRLRVTAVGAVLVLVAGIAAVADVRERQRAAAEEERLASVVELRVGSVASASAAYDRHNDQAQVELVLPVRNRGPRDVVVLSGGVGGYGLARPVEVRAGEQGMLRLTQAVDCASLAERPAAPADTIELSVRTGARVQPRRVELPLPKPLVDEHAQHMCGPVALEQSTTLAIVDVHEAPRTLRLTVEVTTTARRPVDLLGVRAVAPGFEATSPELAGGGVLPLVAGEGATTFQVDVRVIDCVAATTLPEPLTLTAFLEDEGHLQAFLHLHVDPPLRQALVGSSC